MIEVGGPVGVVAGWSERRTHLTSTECRIPGQCSGFGCKSIL